MALTLVAVALDGRASAAPAKPLAPAPVLPGLPASLTQGTCITALAADKRGHTFIATEETGVWRWTPDNPPSEQWQQIGTPPILGDESVYALAVDSAGRLWAGTGHAGLQVWNGRQWRHYGVPEGSPGSRIFALTSSPKDGSVWIGSEAGLAA